MEPDVKGGVLVWSIFPLKGHPVGFHVNYVGKLDGILKGAKARPSLGGIELNSICNKIPQTPKAKNPKEEKIGQRHCPGLGVAVRGHVVGRLQHRLHQTPRHRSVGETVGAVPRSASLIRADVNFILCLSRAPIPIRPIKGQ